MRLKIIALGKIEDTRTSFFVSHVPLPPFPKSIDDVPTYLEVLCPVLEQGLVTKTEELSRQQNKLQFILAVLNVYRLLEIFSQDLNPIVARMRKSEMLGEKAINLINFCVLAKSKYDSEQDGFEKAYIYQNVFDVDFYEEYQDCILKVIEQYPSRSEPGEEAKRLSGIGTPDSESSASSTGREDSISLTNATLRRLLRNYWDFIVDKNIVDDELLSMFWNFSISGYVLPIERLERAICFLPIELSFLYDKADSKIVDFSVGKSGETNIRDLTGEEKLKHMIIIHNHPRRDTFSLADIITCAGKQAQEVRAITIQKCYIAELVLAKSDNLKEDKALINGVYLFFANNGDREFVERLFQKRISEGSLEYNESLFAMLDVLGLINSQGSLKKVYDVSKEEFSRLLFEKTEEGLAALNLTKEHREIIIRRLTVC